MIVAIATTSFNVLTLRRGGDKSQLSLANLETLSTNNENTNQNGGENKNNWTIGEEMVIRSFCTIHNITWSPTTGCLFDGSKYININCCVRANESTCCNRGYHDSRCKN